MTLFNAYLFHVAGVFYGMVLGGCLTRWILKKKAGRRYVDEQNSN